MARRAERTPRRAVEEVRTLLGLDHACGIIPKGAQGFIHLCSNHYGHFGK